MNWWPGSMSSSSLAVWVWLIWHFFNQRLFLRTHPRVSSISPCWCWASFPLETMVNSESDGGCRKGGLGNCHPVSFLCRNLGLFKYTLLSTVFTKAFVAVSSPQSFPSPSTGMGQFSTTYPSGVASLLWRLHTLFRRQQLGVGMGQRSSLCMVWYDDDMIQAFWAIAMLAVAKLHLGNHGLGSSWFSLFISSSLRLAFRFSSPTVIDKGLSSYRTKEGPWSAIAVFLFQVEASKAPWGSELSLTINSWSDKFPLMNLAETLRRYRGKIVDEWVHRLHAEVSERYSGRRVDELFRTVHKANEANYAVLIRNDFQR